MRRRGGVHLVALFAIVAVVLGVSASTVQSATPPKPVVSVTPDTGLADLQVVTMTGTGFAKNASIATLQCRPGATGPEGCDLATLTYLTADASGSFTTKRAVHRLVGIGGTNIDCATPNACVLAAANISNYAESNGVVLGFDRSKPLVKPSVTVTPSTGLVDHQLVTITGSGFTPLATVTVTQCQTSTTSPPSPGPGVIPFGYGSCDFGVSRTVRLGTSQQFTATNFPVQRLITTYGPTGPRQIDCTATAGCVISVRGSGSGTSASFDTPISFDPKQPVAVQDMSITPATGLADHQVVTVRGKGFVPGAQIAVLECGGEACDYTHSRQVTPGLTGAFTLSFAVQRSVSFGYGLGLGGPPPIDCAARAGSCVLRINNFRSSPNTGLSRPLTFDRSRGLVEQTVSVDPAHDLRDNQVVAVHGRGFIPMQPLQLVECDAAVETSGGAALGLCDYSTATVAAVDRHGNVEADYTVRDVVSSYSTLSSCIPRRCVLVALSGAFFGYSVPSVGPALPAPVVQGAAILSGGSVTTSVAALGPAPASSTSDEHVSFPYVTLDFASRDR